MDNIFTSYSFSYIPSKIIEDNFIVSDMMGYISSPHFHFNRRYFNNFLFLYVIDGIFHIKQYGKHITVKKGESVMLSLRDAHEYYSDLKETAFAVWFHFRGGHIDTVMDILNKQKVLPLISDKAVLQDYIQEVFMTSKTRSTSFEVELSAVIYKTVIEMSKHVLVSTEANHSKESSWFTSKITSYIDNHIYDKISLKQLSEAVDLNENYFNNIFKNYFNLSPHKLVIDKKLQFSIELLTSSDKSIGEIAHMLNFSDQSHYNKLFKKNYGITPLKYRKMSGGK